jgi:hypothetical protein
MPWREIDRIEFDYRVTLRSTQPSPQRGVVIESPFLIVSPPGEEHTITPGVYGPSIAAVASLVGTTVRYAEVEENETLHLGFSDGSYIRVIWDYDSWHSW